MFDEPDASCVGCWTVVMQPAQEQVAKLNPHHRQDEKAAAHPAPPESYYKVYEKAEDISYVPEDALKEGLGMVRALKASIKRVDLGSKMRHGVWAAEIEKCVVGVSRERDRGY